MICAGSCKRDLDPTDRSVYREVVGWVKQRPRGTGGVHALTDRKETGRVMCLACVYKLRDTGTAMQGALL